MLSTFPPQDAPATDLALGFAKELSLHLPSDPSHLCFGLCWFFHLFPSVAATPVVTFGFLRLPCDNLLAILCINLKS